MNKYTTMLDIKQTNMNYIYIKMQSESLKNNGQNFNTKNVY